MEYHLNIGSNLGERHDNVRRAARAVIERTAAHEALLSHEVESDPWGYESANRYLNIGLQLTCESTPLQLLDICQAIEREMGSGTHRDEAGNYIDRVVDIDIIAAGDTILHSPRLILPHPRLAGRRFVLAPLSELWPAWRHPITMLTAGEMLENL